jgi:predicted nucleotidyltransferase
VEAITLEELAEEKAEELLPEGLILLGYRGSHSHSTYIEPSDPSGVDDVDLLGVYLAPVEHYLGFGREDAYERWESRYDCVFYELRKFVGLLLKSNSNVRFLQLAMFYPQI